MTKHMNFTRTLTDGLVPVYVTDESGYCVMRGDTIRTVSNVPGNGVMADFIGGADLPSDGNYFGTVRVLFVGEKEPVVMLAETFGLYVRRAADIHVHVNYSHADCDGRVDKEFTYGDNDMLFTPFASLFESLVHSATGYGEEPQEFDGPYAVNFSSDRHGDRRVNVHQQTDEGYVYQEFSECQDARCNPAHRTYRDHRAEAAGY